jgi:DNA ligase-1
MTTLFKPMLACDADLDKLRFPLLASAKLDGVRAVVRDGVVLSRSLKPIPNKFVQDAFKHLEHFDGELVVGDPNSPTVYRDTVSHVMSHDKVDFDLRYYVFDHVRDPNDRYQNRLVKVNNRAKLTQNNCSVITLPQHVVTCLPTLLALEESLLDQGYEGLILRDPDAPYKHGRSTVNEGYLLKLKRFVDAEAIIVNYFEREHNGNEATTNELGRTKRSSHKAGKTGRGDLGGFVLRTPENVEFSCGTGFTDQERTDYWANKDHLLGKIAKYKFFNVGVKTAPRHPVWLGFRDPIDL